jgi:K+-sensing histidine kinase KdpD
VKFSNENCSVSVNACTEEGMLRVDFRDEGVGFSKEALSNLFELFGTDEILNHQEGFGLGLVTAKLIMDLHSGSIKAENNPEKGAKVSLYFKENSTKAI